MSDKLSHFDDSGQAHMVDVGAKAATRREAVAGAFVEAGPRSIAPQLSGAIRRRVGRRVRSSQQREHFVLGGSGGDANPAPG